MSNQGVVRREQVDIGKFESEKEMARTRTLKKAGKMGVKKR